MSRTPFFEFAAEVGLTKHLGGVDATKELVKLCRINPGSYILDVGCGVGVTPCFIARKYDCRVVGVDIIEGMITRSQQRAKREGLLDRLEFRVADAQDLPFEYNTFDAVITESVTALAEDKQQAVNEYVRIAKPGGMIGLNETTWLKYPPPPEMLAWASQDVSTTVAPVTPDEWSAFLKEADLEEIFVKIVPINVQDESKMIITRYGFGEMLRILGRTLRLYLKSKDYRNFVREVQQGGITPDHLEDYFGYGLFIGQKPL